MVWTAGCTGVMSGYAIARQLLGKDPELFRRHTRSWARQVARGIDLEVEVHGADHLRPDQTYVLMANHQSHVDIVALFVGLPMVPGFLAKAELRRVPLFGRAMEVGGHVFVDRAQHRRAVEAIAAAAEQMREGASIVIFPEGTRSRRREVLPFKKGGFHLVKQAGVPLVPIGMRGTAEVLPKHSREIRPGTAHIHIGEPLDPHTVRELPLADLMRTVRERVGELADLPLADDRSGA